MVFKLPEKINTIEEDSPIEIMEEKKDVTQIIKQPSVSNQYIKIHIKLTDITRAVVPRSKGFNKWIAQQTKPNENIVTE